MKVSTIWKSFSGLVFLVILGCSPDAVTSDSIEVLDVSARSEMKLNFTAQLAGENEVPAVETRARGVVTVKVSKDGSYLTYRLIVANIDNIRMAHFHMAPAGSNGDVVAWLYGPTDPTDTYNGLLAEGMITKDEVIGPIAGDFNALLQAIRNGNIYVNVHTTDYPAGELRGQL